MPQASRDAVQYFRSGTSRSISFHHSFSLFLRIPPHLIRFRLRLSHFSYTIEHVPGKLLYTADVLSRAPESASSNSVINDMEHFVLSSIIASLPASSRRLATYSDAQKQDDICKQIREFCSTGWPNKEATPPELKPYWKEKQSFSVCEDLLMFNCRIVVPKKMQRETLEKIHQGHQGIRLCLLRMKSSVWWPGITSHLKELIQNCATCCENARPRREPLMTSPYPWQMVATDLFEYQGQHYLLIVDYFSHYPEVS